MGRKTSPFQETQDHIEQLKVSVSHYSPHLSDADVNSISAVSYVHFLLVDVQFCSCFLVTTHNLNNIRSVLPAAMESQMSWTARQMESRTATKGPPALLCVSPQLGSASPLSAAWLSRPYCETPKKHPSSSTKTHTRERVKQRGGGSQPGKGEPHSVT